MEETSLDDFLDAGTESTESADEADGDGADDETHQDGASDSGAGKAVERADVTSGAGTGGVTPATTTFAWSPRGEVCARCGERTRKRWDSQVGLVCGACKEWSALDS